MTATADRPNVVAVTGGTIWGNRGAEAMLTTVIGKIRDRRPDTLFYVFSYVPSRDRELIHDDRIHVLSCRPASLVLRHFPFALLCWFFGLVGIRIPDRLLSNPIRALRQSDVLLDVSGIAFSDGREKFLPFNILLIWPALLLHVPVIKLAQALGPFKNPLNRICAKLFLPRCRHIYARGAITASHLEELKLSPTKWDLSADIAFLYDPRFSLSSENADRVLELEATLRRWRNEGCGILGVIPSALVYEKSARAGRDYIGPLLKLLEALGSQHRFVLLPNATRAGTDAVFNNDLYVIHQLVEAVRRDYPQLEERVAYVDYDINTASTRRLIALCDTVVTSRFHGMISSLCLGVPPVVIGWSHKYVEVLRDFGLEEYVVDFNASLSDLPDLVARAMRLQDDMRDRLASGLEATRALAGQQFEEIERILS